MTQGYRLMMPGASDEEWHDDLRGAHQAAATRLGVPPSDLDRLKRRVTIDPVVIRRDGARWRSRQVWDYRSKAGAVRLFEMLRIDEALYDH